MEATDQSQRARFIRVSLVGGGTYILEMSEIHALVDEFSVAELGDVFTITVIEMTYAEYAALPEFSGH